MLGWIREYSWRHTLHTEVTCLANLAQSELLASACHNCRGLWCKIHSLVTHEFGNLLVILWRSSAVCLCEPFFFCCYRCIHGRSIKIAEVDKWWHGYWGLGIRFPIAGHGYRKNKSKSRLEVAHSGNPQLVRVWEIYKKTFFIEKVTSTHYKISEEYKWIKETRQLCP